MIINQSEKRTFSVGGKLLGHFSAVLVAWKALWLRLLLRWSTSHYISVKLRVLLWLTPSFVMKLWSSTRMVRGSTSRLLPRLSSRRKPFHSPPDNLKATRSRPRQQASRSGNTAAAWHMHSALTRFDRRVSVPVFPIAYQTYLFPAHSRLELTVVVRRPDDTGPANRRFVAPWPWRRPDRCLANFRCNLPMISDFFVYFFFFILQLTPTLLALLPVRLFPFLCHVFPGQNLSFHHSAPPGSTFFKFSKYFENLSGRGHLSTDSYYKHDICSVKEQRTFLRRNVYI